MPIYIYIYISIYICSQEANKVAELLALSPKDTAASLFETLCEKTEAYNMHHQKIDFMYKYKKHKETKAPASDADLVVVLVVVGG